MQRPPTPPPGLEPIPAEVQETLPPFTRTPHLNVHGLALLNSPTSGRGVYATRPLAPGTTLEISPVLVFPGDEYHDYGQHTQLDSYTFVWSKRSNGQSDMALALGLGSMFNHSPSPNVTWHRHIDQSTISFTTARAIQVGEELFISYGVGRMWWEPPEPTRATSPPPTEESELAALAGLGGEEDNSDDQSERSGFGQGRGVQSSAVSDGVDVLSDLRLWRLTAATDPSTMEVPLARGWVLTVPAQLSGAVTTFVRKVGYNLGSSDGTGWDDVKHLKMVRPAAERGWLEILLCLERPQVDEELVKSSLRTHAWYSEDFPLRSVVVPASGAPNKVRLPEWNALWPTTIRASPADKWVDRKAEAELWEEPERANWARHGFQQALLAARHATTQGQVPVGVYVCPVYEDKERAGGLEAQAYDTRISERLPLRHATLNAVRCISEMRKQANESGEIATKRQATEVANGSDYLLTSMALFITHEPCTFCTMALVHSRVKQVYFLVPSPHSGGLSGAEEQPEDRPLGGENGGPYAIHEKASLNHHFDVFHGIGTMPTEVNPLDGMDA